MSNNFDKYCSRLGYPNSMANDAKKKLGNKASTSELLAVVLSNAKTNNVQPNRSSQPSYLQRQVRLILDDFVCSLLNLLHFIVSKMSFYG